MADNIWHVFPVDDTKEHALETGWATFKYSKLSEDGYVRHAHRRLISNCKCFPSVEEQPNGAFIVIHSSFDGREGLELVNEILNDE